MKPISGFSKMSKVEKIDYIVENILKGDNRSKELIKSFWHSNDKLQSVLDDFSENTLTNFYFPFGVMPNLMINGQLYCVPMAIEESSVVAAASKSAKYWLERGGFKADVVDMKKIGQVHLYWPGKASKLIEFFTSKIDILREACAPITANMEKRGGGLLDLELRDKTDLDESYFQIWASFNTVDAMGANFINSVLERLGKSFRALVFEEESFTGYEKDLQVVMAILSNYTPECLVRATVECPIEMLEDKNVGMSPEEFARKFERAVRISRMDVNRATTHNKGIFNGIDAVILATGNDFRAIEACGHTFAARDGQYRGLTTCSIKDGMFNFTLEIPMALGTVGGLTSLHPMAKFSLELLGKPDAAELMKIVACSGLAQTFAAVRSLVTSGIQKGHMKMHLMNILNHLEASDDEREKVRDKFEEEIISFNGIRDYLQELRNY
ncbi:hydroxymethylglutaryl-CoA reductase, degradative [Candidatus Sororendozoicomonas aggregata]|uniref:hydroxymethylglutaryl-CoA reductase, degradative n=1 Tax=Candidatus Sororendozoicomonas aggregata TaxID=3073239 RepID=UPI002ED273CF